jgi:hypothetical protein
LKIRKSVRKSAKWKKDKDKGVFNSHWLAGPSCQPMIV